MTSVGHGKGTNQVSEELLFGDMSKDALFEYLNCLVNRDNELYNHGIEDDGLKKNIQKIIRSLFKDHAIEENEIKKVHFINYLVDKYDSLDRAWEKADDTGGHGKDKISYEMGMISKELNEIGLDSQGKPLKSLMIVSNIKDAVQSKLNI